jgi:hypothetical protein
MATNIRLRSVDSKDKQICLSHSMAQLLIVFQLLDKDDLPRWWVHDQVACTFAVRCT